MKQYALLVALAIAPSLAHDNMRTEVSYNEATKPKLAIQAEGHQAHAPVAINQDPFNENDTSDERIANRVKLESLIAEAEKTIANLDAIKDEHRPEQRSESSNNNEQSKFAFNKWAGLNQTPSSSYISGGGASGGAGGGSAGGSLGSSKDASNDKASTAADTDMVATAVPEPEVYLMFLAGLGLIGYRAKKSFAK